MYRQWLEFFLFWNVDDDVISSSVGTPFNTHIPMLITWRKEPENSWYVSVPDRKWDVLRHILLISNHDPMNSFQRMWESNIAVCLNMYIFVHKCIWLILQIYINTDFRKGFSKIGWNIFWNRNLTRGRGDYFMGRTINFWMLLNFHRRNF